MPGPLNISFANSAVSDLEDILEFYKEQKIPHVGEKLVGEILKNIDLLSMQPDMGRIVPEFDLKYLRELIRPPFRIVYLRNLNRIRIVRIWRSERMLMMP
ncbi:MAG: type II toxin-antitoxin system RelE/ParE family toxin [Desulfobacterales bacterium]|nr:type II toxin-antitoxin system RelE/ParE family toxin [Desulfobacterales bacterium]